MSFIPLLVHGKCLNVVYILSVFAAVRLHSLPWNQFLRNNLLLPNFLIFHVIQKPPPPAEVFVFHVNVLFHISQSNALNDVSKELPWKKNHLSHFHKIIPSYVLHDLTNAIQFIDD